MVERVVDIDEAVSSILTRRTMDVCNGASCEGDRFESCARPLINTALVFKPKRNFVLPVDKFPMFFVGGVKIEVASQ